MILKSINIIGDQDNFKKDILIERDIIHSIDSILEKKTIECINFKENVIAFPGLINSHEHLGLNTHSIHKSRVYSDYIDWASDNFEDKIKEINAIPFHLRYEWGVIKNILCGFTTIIQHDKGLPNFKCDLVDIELGFKVIHSLHFDPKWRLKSILPSSKMKMIHLGEGVTPRAISEAHRFLFWNSQPKKTIAIHGISIKPQEMKRMGGIVWCPNSNMHLYNSTATINTIKLDTPVLFGTDSTISSDWNIFDHLRQARLMSFLSDEELFDSVSKTPSKLFNWPKKSEIVMGNLADIVIAKQKENDLWNAFYELESSDILLVIKSGKIVFFDESILSEVKKHIQISKFEKIKIFDSHKYLKFPIKALFENIKKYYEKFQLPIGLEIG